jgi:hypothetical protein
MDKARIDFIDASVRARMEEDVTQAVIAERLQMIRDFGEDNYPVGTVFRLPKCFVEGGTTYLYAVIKVDTGKWYTTGKMQYAADWTDFATWCVSGQCPTVFEDLERLYTPDELGEVDPNN